MALTKGNIPVSGFPQPEGKKIGLVFDHTGPSSYTQFASPSTGGDVIKANGSGLNLGGFDDISSGVVDSTGQIIAYTQKINSGYGNSVPSVNVQYWSLVTATVGGQAQTLGTQVAATTDLSGLTFRFRANMV